METKKLDQTLLEQMIRDEAGMIPNPQTVSQGSNMAFDAIHRQANKGRTP